MRSRAWAIGGGVILLLLAGCGANGQTSAAAVVNGHTISATAYKNEFTALRIQTANTAGYDACALKQLAASCGLIKERALNTVIDNELIREYAAAHGISVSSQEAARQWAVVYQDRFHDDKAVLRAFLKVQHTTEAELRASLANDELRQKVMYAVTGNLGGMSKAVRLAKFTANKRSILHQVISLIHHGNGLPHVVQYLRSVSGPVCSETQCGDLGWVPYAFIPASRRSLETHPVGFILGPQPDGTQYSAYLVEARDSAYQPTTNQQYLRREQLFIPWLVRQQHRAKVKRYIAI